MLDTKFLSPPTPVPAVKDKVIKTAKLSLHITQNSGYFWYYIFRGETFNAMLKKRAHMQG